MKKILIIEDDPIVGRIYQSRLEKESYEVEIATDGQTGYYQIHDMQPDAVLLDLMLPKMNGIDILKKIRSHTQFQKIPIVVFTNAYVPNMIQEAFQAGATQVFNKATLTPRQVVDALQTSMYLTVGTVPTSPAPRPSPVNPAGGTPDALTPSAHLQPDPFEPAPSNAPATFFSRLGDKATGPVGNGLPAEEVSRASSDDAADQAEINETFQETAPDVLASIRKLMQDFTKAKDDTTRMSCLLELYRKVHCLTGSAGIAGLHSIAQMAAALEVLLRELHEKPKNINPSTLRTVAHAIDFIVEIFTRGADRQDLLAEPIHILVVDDEILSRRAITYALEKAGLKSASVEDPHMALNLAGQKTYDLIFLDIQMPGMDGFDLCAQIRSSAENKDTPVIFVTSLSDFKSRARSTLSGGTDLIAKPFMFMELSVKALSYVLRGRLAKALGSTAFPRAAVA
jgi:CheY-like chemotaxis protein